MNSKEIKSEYLVGGLIFYINIVLFDGINNYNFLITSTIILVLLLIWTGGKLDDLRQINLYKFAHRSLERGNFIVTNFEGLKSLYKKNVVIEEEGFIIQPQSISLDFLAKDNIDNILLTLYYPYVSNGKDTPYENDYRLRYYLKALIHALGNEELDRLVRSSNLTEYSTYRTGGIDHNVFDVSFTIDGWKSVSYRVGDPVCLLELIESEYERTREILTDLVVDATKTGNTILSFIDRDNKNKYVGSIIIEWKVMKGVSKYLSILKTLGKNVTIISRNTKPTETNLVKYLGYDNIKYGIVNSFPKDVCEEDNILLTRTLSTPSLKKSTTIYSSYSSSIKARKNSNLYEYVNEKGLSGFVKVLRENWEIEQLSERAKEYLDTVIPSLMILLCFISTSRYSGWRGEVTALVLGVGIILLNYFSFIRVDTDIFEPNIKPPKNWTKKLKWIFPIVFLIICFLMQGEKMNNVFLAWAGIACNIPTWIYKNTGTLATFLIPMACLIMSLSFLILC